MNISFYSLLQKEDVFLFQEKITQAIKKQLWDFIKLENIKNDENIIRKHFSSFISIYPQAYQEINTFLNWVSKEGIESAEEKLEVDLKKPNLDKQMKKRTDLIVKNIDLILIKWLSDLIRDGQIYKISPLELMKYLTEKFEETAEKKSEMIVKTEILNALNLTEYETYSFNNVKKVSWIVASGEKNQKDCLENGIAGTIKLGSDFPSGHKFPPNGIYCYCYIMPVK